MVDTIAIPGSMGRLAVGRAFFDRQEIMSRAWELLDTSNLLLLAPRRVGKSSLLHRMYEDGPAKGYKTLYLSIPDAEDELDFMKRLVRGFRDAEWGFSCWRNKLPEDLEIVLKTGLFEMKANNFDWRRPAAELETLLKSSDPQTLLLIDELPLVIASINRQDSTGNRAERFLLWLKRLREQYRPRWFFAGSIGLDSIARRLKLSGTIHDLQPIELGAFSPDKARIFLVGRAEFYHWKLTADTIDAILHGVEWPIPFYLNLVFEELRTVVAERHGSPSPAFVELAMERLVAHGRTHFDHWDERLTKMLDTRAQHFCNIILSIACREASGIGIADIDLRLSQELNDDKERAELLRQLLDLLVSDGYLVRLEAAVHFRSALLRRYWKEVLS